MVEKGIKYILKFASKHPKEIANLWGKLPKKFQNKILKFAAKKGIKQLKQVTIEFVVDNAGTIAKAVVVPIVTLVGANGKKVWVKLKEKQKAEQDDDIEFEQIDETQYEKYRKYERP
jgi:hypothetical protein